MALNFISAKISLLPYILQPICDAIFSLTLPLTYRWRLFLLQPLNLLALAITFPSWFFNNRSSVLYIPTRSGLKRCLIWQPSTRESTDDRQSKGETTRKKVLRPLHIDVHGGGWVGGFPEQDARWCDYLCREVGAVVISISYRFAPRYTFPAAHDDVDDIVCYLVDHASELGADAELLTIGGSSAGGNMALSTAQYLQASAQSQPGRTVVARGFMGFCPPVNLRLKPEEKPKPEGFPEKDPFFWMMPLYDAYAGPNRERDWDDARLNTLLMRKEMLPDDLLLIIAGMDILAHEQLEFVERLRNESGSGRAGEKRVEARVWDKGFHGWLELPKSILEKERMEAFDTAVDFIKRVHRKYGFDVDKSN
ncbi:hypothetical protein N0V90_002569 [Kalmusia sp. IMI 367209]|nr:hypothetical protein N0V90_002569 [Kalmusia sp. IMI 367209]